jgi:enoyl-CoA hydratase/carnithine racemase
VKAAVRACCWPDRAAITLLHVLEPPTAWGEVRPFDVYEQISRDATKSLTDWTQELAAKVSVPVREQIRVGRAGAQLLAAVDEDLPIVMELAGLIEQLASDEDVHVAVFESANPDYFLSHAELRLLQHVRDTGGYDGPGMPAYSALLERVRSLPIATIARVAGRARGGGAELMLAMDMSFGAIGRAYLSQMEIALGILPGGGGAPYLARRIGRARAMEICLGGGDLSAIEAERYGYLNRALPADQLGPFVDELAYRIASYPRRAIALNKAAVNLVEAGREAELVASGAWFAELVKAPEFDRRVAAFLGQSGQTAAGELASFAGWAERLSERPDAA